MKKCMVMLLCCLLLTGCTGGLLEREYSTVEPHSSKFWESEASDILRAETYQDIVNDLLILVGQHIETATLRLYDFQDGLSVTDTLERATTEAQKETPLGAYAVEYITFSVQSQRGYYEIYLQIGYRRSLEQIQAIVNATSTGALYSLLDTALTEERTELVVQVGYWGADDAGRVEEIMAQIREDRGLTEALPWAVYYYPSETEVELIEFDLVGVEVEVPPPEESDVIEEGDTSKGETPPEKLEEKIS